MGTHIIRSVAAPAGAPTSEQLGTHWLKTTDPVGHWLAVDTSVDGWLDLINLPSGGGGSGEANTSSNTGTGVGLAKAKVGANLPFKSLKAGANISLNVSADEIEIVAAGGSPGLADGDYGDITVGAGGTTMAIDVGVVTNTKLANVATATVKGRSTAGSGAPEDLTGTQVTALLDQFTTSLKGLVPPPVTATGKFLKDDGTWAAPASGGGGGGGLEISGGMVPVTVAGNKWYNTWKHRGVTDNAVSAYSGGMWPERFPVVVGGSMTLASIVMEASVAATSKLRLAIYSSDPTTGLPLTKLWEGVKDLAAATNATIAVSPTVALTPGVYWVAVWQSPAFDMVAMDQMDAYFFGDFNMFSSNSSINAATSFPTTINPSTISASFVNSVPKIKLQ